MRNIKLTVQYDGTGYSGWQSQKNSVAVQDVLGEAIRGVTGERPAIIGAARTDAGVHAACQVANFRTASKIELGKLKRGINSNLPPDIAVKGLQETRRDFHAQYDARTKRYRYTVYSGSPVPPIGRHFVSPVKYTLDIGRMREGAKHIRGRHDFSSFQGSNSRRESAVRRVSRIDIKKRGRFIFIDIEGDGFLYNMVRAIAGTLIDVGRGRTDPGDVGKIMKAKDRRLAGSTVPAKGLCLMKVRY
jgi:tRNA pseudouridine38-40 synthase